MMRNISAILVLLPVVFSCQPLAAQMPASQLVDRKSNMQEEVSRWIQQLQSDQFVKRELATQNLISAEYRAIQPLVLAIPDANREAATRIVHILSELSLSESPKISAAAQVALEQIVAAPHKAASRQASSALANLSTLRRGQAILKLQKLGARYDSRNQREGLQVAIGLRTLEINENWTGTEEDFKHLKWLTDVEQVILKGPQVTDACLKQVHGMKNLSYVLIKNAHISNESVVYLKGLNQLKQVTVLYTPLTDGSVKQFQKLEGVLTLKLFGTKISKQGAQSVRDALKGIVVDHRQGAFLGIGCSPHQLGCQVTHVHPNSAAERAGLQIQDVITKYNGKPVADFEGLTKQIAENTAGDSAIVEIIRQNSKLLKTIKLGEWE